MSSSENVVKKKEDCGDIVDEALIKVGPELVWLWVAIESINHQFLAPAISKEGNMFVTERFLPETMENIPFPEMVVHGILKLVDS